MNCIAIDIGAGSGRIIRGTFKDGQIGVVDLHRFKNKMRRIDGHLRWDVVALFKEVCEGLRKVSRTSGGAKASEGPQVPSDGQPPSSIGIDTWGVDFVLLDADMKLLELPVAYRDRRTDGMMELFLKRMARSDVYERTGIQFLPINTLYQLFSMTQREPETLKRARNLLMMPDYLNFLLTGNSAMEFTNATTTQMINIESRDWDEKILDAIPVDPGLFSRPVEPGTVLGELSAAVQERTGLGALPVIAPATHDTGSAVASIPADGKDWAFISSGTWSLMGMEVSHPICTNAALEHNFTNEGGVCGTYRFLKNIMGLWLIAGLRRSVPGRPDFAELEGQAERARTFGCFIDPNDRHFFNPGSMKSAFDGYLRSTDQPLPKTPGAYARCALESLALSYRGVLAELKAAQVGKISRVHIIGGGCQNRLLDQMAADALGLPVFAGPVEGTAVGNLLVQAIALGGIKDIEEGRRMVKGSFNIQKYTPKDTKAWDAAWTRFEHLKER
jgi:rhamnulokinase